ncbi:hypothetical protein Droror1_Dr00002859 [Drosera rotundifolia]
MPAASDVEEEESSCRSGALWGVEVEGKIEEGNIQEAESSLRERLSLNFEMMGGIRCIRNFLDVEGARFVE